MNVSKILSDYEYYPQIDKILRACLNFPIKKYYQVFFLCSLPVFSPVFPCQIARYPPRKNRKTYSEEILKTDPNKV